MMSNAPKREFETECRRHLDRFFAEYPNTALQKNTAKALRVLASEEMPLAGKREVWAAGIIYAVANRDRQAVGVPGILNSEFEAFFAVTMGSVRQRAADVTRRLFLD
jgi:hypothetical protein